MIHEVNITSKAASARVFKSRNRLFHCNKLKTQQNHRKARLGIIIISSNQI